MPITYEQSQKAKDFMNTIEALLYVIDGVSDKIPEGDYLIMMNSLKTLYGFKPDATMKTFVADVRRNPIIIQMDKRARMKVRKQNDIMTDAFKLKNGWKICPLCDSIILELAEHQQTKKCRDCAGAKKLVKTTGAMDNTNLKMGTTLLKAVRLRAQTE